MTLDEFQTASADVASKRPGIERLPRCSLGVAYSAGKINRLLVNSSF